MLALSPVIAPCHAFPSLTCHCALQEAAPSSSFEAVPAVPDTAISRMQHALQNNRPEGVPTLDQLRHMSSEDIRDVCREYVQQMRALLHKLRQPFQHPEGEVLMKAAALEDLDKLLSRWSWIMSAVIVACKGVLDDLLNDPMAKLPDDYWQMVVVSVYSQAYSDRMATSAVADMKACCGLIAEVMGHVHGQTWPSNFLLCSVVIVCHAGSWGMLMHGADVASCLYTLLMLLVYVMLCRAAWCCPQTRR